MRIRIDGRAVYEGDGQLDCLSWGLGGAAAYNASRYTGRECPRAFTLEWEADGQTFRVETPKTRPLKESIAVIGGVPLDEVDPQTMSSRLCEGLYFAGEVLDIDGPTGGYNLSAAFATAALAVRSVQRGNGGRDEQREVL
ncbi:MAG: NAD(P)/FAD-dependent oxidoreductase [Kiritimatiellae bacterium]|nr:NAD(P)/FAD-dependent oxidoreductase [Kiritimatiellia bacterium]